MNEDAYPVPAIVTPAAAGWRIVQSNVWVDERVPDDRLDRLVDVDLLEWRPIAAFMYDTDGAWWPMVSGDYGDGGALTHYDDTKHQGRYLALLGPGQQPDDELRRTAVSQIQWHRAKRREHQETPAT